MAAKKKQAKDSDEDVDNITPLFKGERIDRGEVVIGLVGAMGTDMDRITHELAAAFTAVGYEADPVQVSTLIRDFMTFQKVKAPKRKDGTKLDELMDLGDALREGLEHGGAAAVLAVGKIKNTRTEAQLKFEGKTDEDDEVEIVERKNVATIVRQFKHPQEVEVFRSIYGTRFLLLGVYSPEKEREEAVNRRLHDEHPGKPEEWYAKQVRRLLIRDEQDTKKKLGQRVRATYELADAFIADSPGPDTARQIQRFVHLLFGSPYVTPSKDEHAMFVAAGASLRSSDAGRQVGAVVVDKDGEILVSGVNEIPKPGGGQYWSEDKDDLRDFQLGFDENARQKRAIITEILRSLQEQHWLADHKSATPEVLASEAMSMKGPLTKSRVADLLEFARVAHAEMAAICTAARRGTPIGGQTMYTTTYPCHECARLVIASGITRVVYVDPYPKSQVRAMYSHEVTEEVQEGKVAFQPYRGIAPRLYRSVFQMTGRSRDSVSGMYEKWKASEARPRLANEAMVLNNVIAAEDQFYEGAFAFLQETDWIEVIKKTLAEDED
jgi:deoxycytidylate deaminase